MSFFFLYVCLYVCARLCVTARALTGLCSLLPCESRELSSGREAWQQVALLTEPSRWPRYLS